MTNLYFKMYRECLVSSYFVIKSITFSVITINIFYAFHHYSVKDAKIPFHVCSMFLIWNGLQSYKFLIQQVRMLNNRIRFLY